MGRTSTPHLFQVFTVQSHLITEAEGRTVTTYLYRPRLFLYRPRLLSIGHVCLFVCPDFSSESEGRTRPKLGGWVWLGPT